MRHAVFRKDVHICRRLPNWIIQPEWSRINEIDYSKIISKFPDVESDPPDAQVSEGQMIGI